jgi:uncharacterized protein with PIN domain
MTDTEAPPVLPTPIEPAPEPKLVRCPDCNTPILARPCGTIAMQRPKLNNQGNGVVMEPITVIDSEFYCPTCIKTVN